MKVAVYIGRFQPFHYGHQAIVDHVRSLDYDKLLILVGTPTVYSDRNPIESYLVKYNLYTSLSKEDTVSDLVIRQLQDTDCNLQWVQTINSICSDLFPTAELHLVIHNKPSEAGKYGLEPDQFISDFILENSRIITGSIDLSNLDTPQINATDIRNAMSELLKLAPKQSLLNLLNAM